jgi:hypothetical protein
MNLNILGYLLPSLPAGGRARLYHRPDRLNPINNFADRASRCFHLWHERILFSIQITGVNVKVRSTDCSPTAMCTR